MFDILHFESLDSTNEEARRRLTTGQIETLTIIQADTQTAGRGTQGRAWISPPGAGLYFSIAHPFERLNQQHIAVTPLFTLAAGLACAEALRELTGIIVQLKPINDLYADGRKLGGILTESIVRDGQCKALITGIGINILSHASVEIGCQTEGRETEPTSLQACLPPQVFQLFQLADTGRMAAVQSELMESIARHVNARYTQLIAGDTPAILGDYVQFKMPPFDLPSEISAMIVGK